jgi:hypothetical protein
MRKLVFSLVCLLLFSSGSYGITPDLGQFSTQLNQVSDQRLRTTLENSIKIGLIKTPEELNQALQRAKTRSITPSFDSSSRYDWDAMKSDIQRISAKIPSLDRDAVEVEKIDGYKSRLLFKEISCELPKSYELAYSLCEKFDPRNGTNDHKELDKEIDYFLGQIADDPVIKYALRETNTNIEDLKRNWFGSGLGFEHIISGELKGSSVSGYHWWFRFYRDERRDMADVISSFNDIGNDCIYTGNFYWDPDGDGPLPRGKRRIGGFSVGNSVQSVLALGHIAIETARKYGGVPGALSFRANINGEEYKWQMYTMHGNIRSLYPYGNQKTGCDQRNK